jgi:hypothetical protein
MGSFLGSLTILAKALGVAYSMTVAARTAASTSPGWAPRGHRVEQSPQLWHSQTSPLPINRSFNPQDVAIISFLGNGLVSGEMGQATEQVAH